MLTFAVKEPTYPLKNSVNLNGGPFCLSLKKNIAPSSSLEIFKKDFAKEKLYAPLLDLVGEANFYSRYWRC